VSGVAQPRPGRSLGTELERHRLEVRVRQLERVIAVLQLRSRAADAAGRERRGLQRAIVDFRAELRDARRRLVSG
jgi:hypothetical protein